MTKHDAIKHLSYKIAYAKRSDEKWVDCIHIEALEIAVRAMAEEQPEVIRCKDCKWGDRHGTTDEGKPYYYCVITDWAGQPPEFFCANGEREEKNDAEIH